MNFRKLNFVRTLTIKRRLNRFKSKDHPLQSILKKLQLEDILSRDLVNLRKKLKGNIKKTRKALREHGWFAPDNSNLSIELGKCYLDLAEIGLYDLDTLPRRLLAKYYLWRAEKNLEKGKNFIETIDGFIARGKIDAGFYNIFPIRRERLNENMGRLPEIQLRLAFC